METYNPAILAIAKQFQCPPANVIKQYRSNAAGMRQMAKTAAKKGKCNGYTETQLLDKAAAYERIANGGTTTALSAAMGTISYLQRLAR